MDGIAPVLTIKEMIMLNKKILLTAAAPGSIPANVWRTSHVIYL